MLWTIFTGTFALAGGLLYLGFSLIWLILLVIARWIVFSKAGEPGWKSIIPIYNTYTSYKIAWTTNMFWISLIFTFLGNLFTAMSDDRFWSIAGMLGGICSLVAAVIAFGYSMNLAKSFGKGILFGIGLWLLEPIFTMILAFGPAQYQRGNRFY